MNLTNRYIFISAAMVFLLFIACQGNQNNQEQLDSDQVDPAGEMLPEPNATPSVAKFAKTIGWPDGTLPQVTEGFSVTKFADGLQNPRWLYELPNGDLLVAEASTEGFSNMTPEMEKIFRQAALVGESANRITLLRDRDNDGTPEERHTFLENLNKPIGMLLLNSHFYVANTNGVYRWPYKEGSTTICLPGEKILDLPEGGYNNHWTRNIIADPASEKIYITCGSQTNADVEGLDAQQPRRATIMRCNPDGSDFEIFVTGIRNPLGMAFEPETEVLWTTVNERDELGDDLVPDYMTRVRKGDFYGWPYAYWGANRDPRHPDAPQEIIENSIVPDLSLGAHTASLGLEFCQNESWPAQYQGGAFIGQHGSWNRSVFSGYKVLFVPFEKGMPTGEKIDFLSGFIADEEKAEVYGRPVHAIVHSNGSMYVTDDAANTIWRVILAES